VNALNYCHSEADFTGEESAAASKTADSSRDTAALRKDSFDNGSYCTTTGGYRNFAAPCSRIKRLPPRICS